MNRIHRSLFTLVACCAVAACATKQLPPPEPVVVVKEVKVAVAVPCAALQQLGPEPAYPDTDAALKAAPNLFARVKLMVQGRILRIARLAEYKVAKNSCQ